MKFYLLMTLFFCFSCASSNSKNHFNNYKNEAKRLISLNKANASGEILNQSALKLMKLSQPLFKSFKMKNPQCTNFLAFIERNKTKMMSLSHQQIEKDFHEGEALPKASEKCFDVKELVVHPATVSILSKNKLTSELRESIADEIHEVLDHIDDLQEDL